MTLMLLCRNCFATYKLKGDLKLKDREPGVPCDLAGGQEVEVECIHIEEMTK